MIVRIFALLQLKTPGYYVIFEERNVKYNLDGTVEDRQIIDIVGIRGMGKVVWEVKAIGLDPNPQLERYTNGTGYGRGGYIPLRTDSYGLAHITTDHQYTVFMDLTQDEMGGIYYETWVDDTGEKLRPQGAYNVIVTAYRKGTLTQYEMPNEVYD